MGIGDSSISRPRVGSEAAGTATASATGGLETYQKQLDADPRWALSEGSKFFEGGGAVQESLRRITRRLNELGIPYAVVGGMALFRHGYRRFTEDVDLLVTRVGLRLIHEKLDGLGYIPPFPHSKNLLDTESRVKIEFLVTGDYPGDGKPKPVAFPDPAAESFEADEIRYLNLNKVIELKLASGMSNAARAKDLVDVMELIKTLNLPFAYSDQVDPYVREKFNELWRNSRRRFVKPWPIKAMTRPKTLDELIDATGHADQELIAMQNDGVILEAPAGMADYVHLVTTEPAVAEKYGMAEASEFWDEDSN